MMRKSFAVCCVSAVQHLHVDVLRLQPSVNHPRVFCGCREGFSSPFSLGAPSDGSDGRSFCYLATLGPAPSVSRCEEALWTSVVSEAGRESPESRLSDRSRRTCDREGFESSEDGVTKSHIYCFWYFSETWTCFHSCVRDRDRDRPVSDVTRRAWKTKCHFPSVNVNNRISCPSSLLFLQAICVQVSTTD